MMQYLVRAHTEHQTFYLRFYKTETANEPCEQWHPAWTRDRNAAYTYDGPTLAQASLNTRIERDELPEGVVDQDIVEA